MNRPRPVALAILAAVLIPLAQPAPASAHSGLTAQVASDYVDTIDPVPVGLEVKIVDGDQNLWMSANPRLTVVVSGLRGEPYLRFVASGVYVNVHAPSYYLNRGFPQALPAGLTASTPPLWRRVSSGHTYMWHEDRLHALALGGPAPPAGEVATWTVPVTVNGARAHLGGELLYQPPPSRLWLWPLVVAILCAAAVVRLGCDVARPFARVLAVLALPAIVAGRLGRELYGHPDLSIWQMTDAVLTCLIAAVLAYALIRRRQVQLATLVTGAWALYEGAFLLPVLTRGYVLAALPATPERAAACVCLVCGPAILLAAVVFELPALPRPRLAPPAEGEESHALG